MSIKATAIGLALLATTAMTVIGAGAAYAADPDIRQVYQAAEGGNLDGAKAMMVQVLHDHPNSAKAHFVEAEILSKQGQVADAKGELAKAEQLAPGLPFAAPKSVGSLKARLAGTGGQPPQMAAHPAQATIPMAASASAPPTGGQHFPWLGLLFGGGALWLVANFARSFMRRGTQMVAGGARPNPLYSPAPSAPPFGGFGGMGGGMGPAAPSAPSGGGMGSGIMGGLMTGVAAGAGMVAGEKLIHHFMDDKPDHSNGGMGYAPTAPTATPDAPYPSGNGLGGDDFGVGGTSWDDNGGGGDWGDNGGGNDWD